MDERLQREEIPGWDRKKHPQTDAVSEKSRAEKRRRRGQKRALQAVETAKKMRTKNWIRIGVLAVIAIACVAFYLTINSYPENPELNRYIISLRLPTLVSMLIASVAIGTSTMIFQSIVNNRIVTPALLGMNSIYSFLHTAVVFVLGTGSVLYLNANLAFAVDLILMGVVATFVYWYMFKVTGHNVLYIMLIGTVLSSLFGSLQSSMVRVLNPDEYDALLMTLVADFNNVNGEIIAFAIVSLLGIGLLLRNDIKLLDVITLGRDQAINLGVDYDKEVRKLLFGVVLCMAIATATIGPVSFLGLIVASLSRQVMKTYRHSFLIAAASLLGMIALIGGQLIAQHVFHFAVPVSTFITIAGGVFFLYLLLFKKGVY